MRNLLYFFIWMFATGLASCSEWGERETEYLHARVDTLLEKGTQHEEQGNVRQALVCYWDALDLLEEEPDSVLKAKTYQRLGDLLFRYGVYEKAVAHHREGYNLAQKLADGTLQYEAARKLALDYAQMHQTDTADYFLRQSRQIALQNGVKREVITEVGLTDTQYADSIGTLYDRERILSWEAKYKEQKALLHAEQQRAKELGILALFLALVILLSVLWFIAYRRKKKEAEERERQLRWFDRLLEDTRSELAGNQAELFASRGRIRELQQALADNHASVQENKRLHEELAYYVQQESEMFAHEKALREREKALLSEGSLMAVTLLNRMKNAPSYNPVRSETEWQALRSFADLLYPGYLQELTADNGLTERERKLCLLVRLGFSTGQLALFEGISPGSVTKAKFRIQKKLKEWKDEDVRMRLGLKEGTNHSL